MRYPAFLLAALLASLGACESVGTPDPAAPAVAAPEVALVRQAARPITGSPSDYDPLVALAADARVVLLGESTHGTHEFYVQRDRITRRLIEERGFGAVAIEGDWPDAYRVNRWVRGEGTDASAEQALSSFTRFPEWMWRNQEVRDFVRWLRAYNDARPPAERVGFYGLDVYSLYPSADEVLRYLASADPAAEARVREMYRCFERHRPDPAVYGQAAARGSSCRAQAEAAVAELQARPRPADPSAAEALFSALRNAHSVANAESYFRTSFTGETNTWNLRDRRMAEGLAALEGHLQAGAARTPRIVVWAHNTHSGDARATQAGQAGELNVGQLMRERHGERAVLVGMHTYGGTVLAASAWDEPGRVQTVRPALAESWSALFHATGIPDFLLVLRGGGAVRETLSAPRLERAIGVVYVPQTERQSHYFSSSLGERFDASIFFDRTRAVTPLR